MTDRPVCVYRIFDADGNPIYVGCTVDPVIRLQAHRYKAPWWHLYATHDLQWFDTDREGAAAEKAAIEELQPPFNKSGRTRTYGRYRSDNRVVVVNGERRVRGVTPEPERSRLLAALAEYEANRRELKAAIIDAHSPPDGQQGGSVRDLAELTGRSTNTIQRWLKDGAGE